MSNVIDLEKRKRARLGRGRPHDRRARPSRRREENGDMRHIGEISLEMLRKLME